MSLQKRNVHGTKFSLRWLESMINVTRVKERERKRRIHSEQKFIGFFDTDDDMATVRVTAPKMLADLGDTVILEQLKGQ